MSESGRYESEMSQESFRLEKSSKDHKYWLEKYYQQICAFEN